MLPAAALTVQADEPTTPSASTPDQVSSEEAFQHDVVPFLEMHCVGCHGGKKPKAELPLDQFVKHADVDSDRDSWQAVFDMVSGHEMPPEDRPQPSAAERDRFLVWISARLEEFDCSEHRHPGRVTIRRLNRTEYDNTIRDLVGVDFHPSQDFPDDNLGNGFDNMGEMLSLPPLLMEKYVAAAEQIVDRMLADKSLRDQIIFCRPSQEVSARDCVQRIVRRFVTRAYRRPARQGEIDRLMLLAKAANDHGRDFDHSVGFAIQAVLVSPHFLFRVELDDELPETESRLLNDYELATRLSYFLWSSMPDRQLFQVAASGKLSQDKVLNEQIQRMLLDPKSDALVENLVGQWLQLRALAIMEPDPEQYPDFDEALREAMEQETLHFFQHVMRSDRSVLEILDADYSFVNERLARHYGFNEVSGRDFRKVKLTDSRRGGVLTHASVLTLTSNPTRTSPVKRGKWILENILGTPPPPPPPNVEELAEGDDAELLGSLRERMEQHRADPNCAVCHTKMDALGFGFENFDGIGAWREKDGKFQIDPSGTLPGGRSFQGPSDLRAILKTSYRDDFVRCLAEKVLTFAVGRGLESYDGCAVDEIIAELENNDYRFSVLIEAIVRSDPFRMRGSKGD